jgi:hypothetical protein
MKAKMKWLNIDGGKLLLVVAALVQGAQYAQAFLMVHTALGNYALAGGIMAGLVVVGAVAYVGNRLPRVASKRARSGGTILFVLALVLSPLVLTPVNWYGMDAGLRAAIGSYAWVLAGLVASLPELAIGMVALVDRSLISLSAAQPAGSYGAGQISAAQAAKPAGRLRAATSQAAKTYECIVAGCGYSTGSQSSFAAHMSHHNRKARRDALAGALFGTTGKEKV